MKLLKEYYSLAPNQDLLKELKEKNNRGEPMIVTGIIQRADAKNQNGRIYPKDILESETKRYIDEFVNKGFALGCLDHTDSPVIELRHVSHKINKVWWEGNDVLGEVQILDTPDGKIAKEMVLSGIPLGISSRAVGSVSKNESKGADVVEEDLQLICWDLVGVPSTQDAFLRLREGLEITNFDRSKILPKELRIKEALEELLKKAK